MNLLAGSGSGAVNPINAAAAASPAEPETLESVVAAAKIGPDAAPTPEAAAPTPPTPPTPEPPKDEEPEGESRWKALITAPALLLLAILLMGSGLYMHFSDVAKKQAADNRASYQQVVDQRAADQQKSNITTLVVKNLSGNTATFQDIQVNGTATINNLLARLGQIDQLNAINTTTETLVVRGATTSGSTATGSLNVSGDTTLAGLTSNGQVWLTGDSNDVLVIQAQQAGQNLVSLRNASGAEVTSLDSSGNLSLGGNANVAGTLTVPTAHVGDLTASTATIGSLITSGQGVFTATPTGSGVNQGTVYINPATANPANTLLGLAVGGVEKLRVDASGNLTNAGTLNVAGNTILNGSLQAGASTLSSLGVANNTTIGGTLGVTGDINTNGLYTVNGVQISSANLSNDANLAKLNGTQTFTGSNTFTAPALFQNASNSSTAFRVLDAGGGSLINANTTATTVGVGGATSVYTLKVTNTTTGKLAALGVNNADPNQLADVVNFQTNGANNLTINYGGRTTIRNTINSTSGFSVVNAAAGSVFNLDTVNSALTANTSATFKNQADSTTAFQIQNAAGAKLFNVDTLNSTVAIGNGNIPSLMSLPGVAGSYANTPDSAATSITGDIDIRARVAMNDWTPAANGMLVTKWATSGQSAYRLYMATTGRMIFTFTADGTTPIALTSGSQTGFVDGTAHWVRVTRSATTGDVNFYTASDSTSVPSSWTQLGSTQTGATGSMFDSTADVEVGAAIGGAFSPLAANVYQALIYNGINGTAVANFDPTRATSLSDTTFTATTGEVWTRNGSAVFLGSNSISVVNSLTSLYGPVMVQTLSGTAGSVAVCRNADNQLATCTVNPTGVTLQQAYNASAGGATPEILLDATRGGLTVADASSPIGAALLSVTNNAGDFNYFSTSASGTNITGPLTLGRIAASGTVTPGSLIFADGTTDNFGATLNTMTLTANRTITLPNESGTVCTTGSVCAGYAPASGSGNYVQNGTALQANANFNIQSAAAGSIGGIIRGAASQTADLLDLQSSGGGNLLSVNSDGTLNTLRRINAGASATPTGTVGSINAVPLTAASVGLVVRGLASQTANLAEYQNNGGTALSGVDASGNFFLNAGQSLKVTGSTAFPSSPTEGQVYYRTDNKQLYTYENGKWQADRSTATLIVAASNSQNKEKADYVGDGTNDQTAINSAIAALPSTGGSVVLLDGTYNIASTITMNKANVNLTGQGNSTVLKRMYDESAANTGGVITITTASNSISQLKIDGNKATYTSINDYGIFNNAVAAVANYNKLINNTIVNTGGNGIYMYGNATLFNTNQYIAGNTITGAGGHGIYSNYPGANASGYVITGNVVSGNAGSGIVDDGSGQSLSVTGNTSYNNTGNGFMIASPNSTVTGNTSRSNGGIGFANISGSTYSGNTAVSNTSHGFSATMGASTTLTGNISKSNGGTGIFCDYSANTNGQALIANNTVASNSLNGIWLNAAFNQSTVTGNEITDNGGSGNSSGIVLNANAGPPNAIQVTNNTITDTAGTGYAISLSSSNTYLADNTYSGTGASSIQDLGTGTIYANQRDSNGNIVMRGQAGVGINTTSPTASLQNTGALVNGAVATPAAPTVAAQGTTGATSWGYKVTAYDGLGETLASTETTIANGNATLSVTDFNRITPVRVSGAVSYKIYRTTAGGTPATTGLIGTLAGGATTFRFDDTGLAATTAVPSVNTTGSATIASSLGLGLTPVSGAGLIQLASGTTAANGIAFGSDTNLYRSGAGILQTDSRIVTTGGSSGGLSAHFGAGASGAVGYVDVNGSASGVLQVNSYVGVGSLLQGAAGSTAVVVKGQVGQTGDLQQFQNSSGAVLFGVGSTGSLLSGTNASGMTFVGSAASNNTFNFIASDAGPRLKLADTGLTDIGGYTGGLASATWRLGGDGSNSFLSPQTTNANANLITLGTGYLRVAPGSGLVGINTAVNSTPTASLQVKAFSASTIGSIIQGAASQSADLLRVTDSSSNVLTSIDSVGKLRVVVADSSAGAYGLYVSNTPASGTPNGIYARTGQNGTNFIYAAGVGSDTPFWGIQGNKKMVFGDGAGAFDTNLYRSAADSLATDDNFTANSLNTPFTVTLGTGTGDTTTLSRLAGGNLGTSGGVFATGQLVAANGTAGQVNIGQIGPGSSAALLIGADTNLYRSSANILKTDDGFDAVGSIRGSSFVYAGIGTASQIVMGDVGGQGLAKIGFGSAGDTNLYRSAADTLKTDDALIVGGTLGANSTSAFQVQSTSGVSVLNADTTNSNVAVRGINSDAVVGAELVTTTDYTNAAWTSTNWNTTSTTAQHTTGNVSPLSTNQFTPVAGATYQITFTVTGNPTAGESVTPRIGGTNGVAITGNATTQVQVITAANTSSFQFTPTTNWNGTLSIVSIMRLTNSNTALSVQNSTGVASLEVRTSSSATNTFVGTASGRSNTTGYYLTALGANALQNNTTGAFNTATGAEALMNNTTGGSNAAFGTQALKSNTTGSQNTAVGNGALISNTTGPDNTAVGRYALGNNTTASANTAVGSSALFNTTTGANNVGVGTSVLQGNTTGFQNAVIGAGAFGSNTTGANNVGLGYQAGYTTTPANANTTGSGNTFIGGLSGPGSATQLQNATAIGFRSVVTQSDTLILGCTSGVNGCTATTKVGIGNSAPTNTLGVTGTIGASGSITASTTPDISETISADPDVEPADVVSADPNNTEHARKSQGAYDSTVLGVISDGTSSFKINSHAGAEGADPTGKYLVLAGRVPVKVTNEGGAIHPGDYLTASSTPGKAMKATHAGPTIGKALADFTGTEGSVMIQTNLSYYDPSSGSQVQGQGSDFTDLNASGTATIANLTVTGTANFVDIVVNGHIITGGGQPTALALASGGTATVEGTDTTGTLTITTGATPVAGGLVKVSFSKSYTAAPRVVLSASSDTAADLRIYKDSATTGYVLINSKDAPAPNTTYKFDYFIAQ